MRLDPADAGAKRGHVASAAKETRHLEMAAMVGTSLVTSSIKRDGKLLVAMVRRVTACNAPSDQNRATLCTCAGSRSSAQTPSKS
jgi:hypothetical protein